MRIVSYSTLHEDVMLYRALRNVENGCYIDVGANHPIISSITKLFYDKGWRGINVEPLPNMFKELSKHRPEDINMYAAVSDSVGHGEIYINPYHSGESTMHKDVMPNENVGLTIVNTVTMKEVCDEIPEGKEVHFLKIDVEGYERVVLETMDFVATRPWIVMAETHDPEWHKVWSNHWPEIYEGVEDYKAWEHILLEADYTFVHGDGANRFYVANEHSDLNEAFKYPPNCWDVYTPSELVRCRNHLLKVVSENLNILGDSISNSRRQELNNKFQEIVRMFQS